LSPSYLAVAKGVRELHRLVRSGLEDSPEADAIRDATDGPWEALSDMERDRVRGLSEDLYAITEPNTGPLLEMNPQAQAQLIEAVEARQRGDLDRALGLLRRLERHVAPALLHALRGEIWLDAGDLETAEMFFASAVELEPRNGILLSNWLLVLNQVDSMKARQHAEEILRAPSDYPPSAVAHAANVEFEASRGPADVDSTSVVRRLIPILEQTLSRLEAIPESDADPQASEFVVGLLGRCHESLGNTQAAARCYSLGLRRHPDSGPLLASRGLLLYGSSPQAVADLENATRFDYPAIWPYYLLAHHYLRSSRYLECLEMCRRAAGLASSSAVKSEMTEWSAIAQAHLGFPADLVRASFEEAIRIDPSNERASRNLASFEGSGSLAGPWPWTTRTEPAVRRSGLDERHHQRAA
jgi:tetratricopeptide (TPR) repeat protein